MSADYSAQHGPFQIEAIVTDPPWYENCYIVRHTATGEQIIFDPGNNPDRILASVRANGGKVVEILLTHGHPDHVGAVQVIQDTLGVECRIHERDKPILDDVVRFAARSLGVSVEAVRSAKTFDDHTVFSLGGERFTSIACPGHTPGSVVFDFGPFALTGDTLFNHGVGRTDLPGGDGRALLASISALLGQLAPECQLYCGHGPIWTAEEAREWWPQLLGMSGSFL